MACFTLLYFVCLYVLYLSCVWTFSYFWWNTNGPDIDYFSFFVFTKFGIKHTWDNEEQNLILLVTVPLHGVQGKTFKEGTEFKKSSLLKTSSRQTLYITRRSKEASAKTMKLMAPGSGGFGARVGEGSMAAIVKVNYLIRNILVDLRTLIKKLEIFVQVIIL